VSRARGIVGALVAVAVVGPATVAVAGPSAAAEPDLAVTIRDDVDPVAVGDSLAYRVSVANHGARPARDVAVALSFGGLPSESLEAAPSCRIVTDGAVCGIERLQAEERVDLDFRRRPLAAGVLVATALVVAADDPEPANNVAVESTTVRAVTEAPSPSPTITAVASPVPTVTAASA